MGQVQDGATAPGWEPCNEVVLRGRVAADAEEVDLPSGDPLWTVRVVVPRPLATGRVRSDWVVCAAWSARTRRAVSRWRAGDVVEVRGALRRRFVPVGARTVVEVELSEARRVTRAAPGGRRVAASAP